MIIITGTYPPEKCGVGDYTYNILQTEAAKSWKLYYSKDWSLRTFNKKRKGICALGDENINLQYPSIGYGTSLLPHLLCVYFRLFTSKKVTVTLHEFTQMGWKGKVFALVLFLFSWKMIFTNEFERDSAIKYYRGVKSKSSIIKIYSNIKVSERLLPIKKRSLDMVYFGYIRPDKGLEVFLETLILLKQQGHEIKSVIMGQTQVLYKDYCDAILTKAKQEGVTLLLNKEEDFVADTLSNTKLVYLPFPDGVSERRGSFLACLRNECLLLTTCGPFTTPKHADICRFAATPALAAPTVLAWLSEDEAYYQVYTESLRKFQKEELPASWNAVAQAYNNFLD